MVVVVHIRSRWVDGAGDGQVLEGLRYAMRATEGADRVRDHLVLSRFLLGADEAVGMLVFGSLAKGMSAEVL